MERPLHLIAAFRARLRNHQFKGAMHEHFLFPVNRSLEVIIVFYPIHADFWKIKSIPHRTPGKPGR